MLTLDYHITTNEAHSSVQYKIAYGWDKLIL